MPKRKIRDAPCRLGQINEAFGRIAVTTTACAAIPATDAQARLYGPYPWIARASEVDVPTTVIKNWITKIFLNAISRFNSAYAGDANGSSTKFSDRIASSEAMRGSA